MARDDAAEARDTASAHAAYAQQADGDRSFAAGDRAAAAADREQAALDRHRSADDLQNAYRDELTGALVRRAGWDQLSRAVDRSHRTGESLIVAFVDVDHLKRVNDEQGHVGGDVVLRAVGAALRTGLRSYDIVLRYGGDEFVCGLTDLRLAESERRFAYVSDVLSRAASGASISVGLAELRDKENIAAVIDRADHEMYERRKMRRTDASDTA